MLGALAKATGLFTLDEIEDHMRKSFGKKFSEKVVEGNVQAVRRAYEEVQG